LNQILDIERDVKAETMIQLENANEKIVALEEKVKDLKVSTQESLVIKANSIIRTVHY